MHTLKFKKIKSQNCLFLMVHYNYFTHKAWYKQNKWSYSSPFWFCCKT